MPRRAVPAELQEQREVLEPVDVSWVPQEVVGSCTGALRRIDDRSAYTLAVTSAVQGEGRTTIAMGAALAQRNWQGRRTVLLDLDPASQRPSLAERAGIPSTPGLAGVLRGEASLEDCIAWPAEHLGVLPSGDNGDAPPAIRWAAVSSLVTDLRRAGYAVVADLPPLAVDATGERLVDLFSTVLLVVRAGSTPVDVVRTAAATLTDPPLVILNRKASSLPRWLRMLGA